MRYLFATIATLGLATSAQAAPPNFQSEAEDAAAQVRNSLSGSDGGVSFGGVKIDPGTVGFDESSMNSGTVQQLKDRAGPDAGRMTGDLPSSGSPPGYEMRPGETFNADIMESMRQSQSRVSEQDLSEFEGGALVSEGNLLQFGAESVFGGCREITTTETELIGKPRQTRRSCIRSQGVQFEPCTVTRTLHVRVEDVSNFFKDLVYYFGSSTPWQGSEECLDLLNKRTQLLSNGCSFEVRADAPESKVINGVRVTKTSTDRLGIRPPTYLDFGPSLGGVGNRFTDRIDVVKANCSAPSGTISFSGITGTITAENSCDTMDFTGCRLETLNCIQPETGAFGNYCAEEEMIYSCDVPGTQRSREITKTELVCGNDDEIYCVDGSCFTQVEESNADFGQAIAMLSAVQGIASHMECSDPNDPSTCRVFEGEELSCRKGRGAFSSLWNCCDIGNGENKIESDEYIKTIVEAGANFSVSLFKDGVKTFFDSAEGIIKFLVPCNKEEMKLATTSTVDARVYLGRRCGKKINLGFSKVCIRRDSHFCTWESPLGRIIMEQANQQVGRGFGGPRSGNCNGLTLNEVQNLDWNAMDFSEWADMMFEAGAMDTVGLEVGPDEVNSKLIQP